MKSVSFWRMQVRGLSLTERIFFRDAIKTLLSWDTIREECVELDVVRRILDSEIRVVQPTEAEDGSNRRNSLSKRQSFGHPAEQTGVQSAHDSLGVTGSLPAEGEQTEAGSDAIPVHPLPV